MKKLKLFKLKLRRWYENFIRIRYIKMQRGVNFVKEAYQVRVKKGDLKYYLLVVETYDGRKLRFNLGRHLTKDCEIQELLIKAKSN